MVALLLFKLLALAALIIFYKSFKSSGSIKVLHYIYAQGYQKYQKEKRIVPKLQFYMTAQEQSNYINIQKCQ